MKNKKLIIPIIIVSILLIDVIIFFSTKKEVKKSDGERFAEEYSTMSSDNRFTYRSIQEIINILKRGTGVVYLGFPECPWCSEYVIHLNEVATASGITKIYYKNILNERKNNTEEYQELVSILSDYLRYDEEGNKRIYVPAVIVVKEGKIIGFDDETSYDTKGYSTPKEYWENEDLKGLKSKLTDLFNQIDSSSCTTECNR